MTGQKRILMMRKQHRRYHNSGRPGRGSRFQDGYGRFRQRLNRAAGGNGLYRSRGGIFMGVCKGVAEYFNFSVFWTRLVTLVLFFVTGFWPVGGIYIIAGLLMKMEPVSPIHTDVDREFYDSYTQSRAAAIQRIKRKFDNIERRIQRMEHTVTSREFDWK